ncbi:MAG: PH domain-containing protein, partial [Planctomycetota bacterium]
MISENPNPSGYTFYPEKKVFIYYFTLYAAFLLFAVSSLLAGILAVLQVEHSFVYAYSIAFFILLYLFINRWVGYKKTSYQILEDRLVQNLGGLFYQNCSELLLKNITHIGMSRAFPEYQLFGTSRIFADAAGRSNQEIVFIAIANGESIEESILEKMRVKGFSLKKENLQAQLKQQWTGILWDSLSLFLYVLFIIGVLALNIIFDENLKNANFHALIILCAVLGTLLFLYCLYYFFLNRSALYSIYEDTLVEEKNFFNFYRTQMPMENLTDVSLKQNLIKVLLGLYDVVVSCEGVGKEFYIPNIREGENIRALLGTLIVKAKDQQKNEEENSQAEITAPESSSIITGSLSKPVFQESLPNSSSSENTIPSFTFELAMFPKRVYFLASFFLVLTLLYTLGITLA